MKTIAIIPVYQNITEAVNVLKKFRNEVDKIFIIVDCPTKKELDEMRKIASKIMIPNNIITHEKRKGVGYGIRKGIEHGLKNNFDVAVIMAGNGKDDP